MKNDAFISYSHASGKVIAPALQRGLEKFAKPTFKRYALNIFRDTDDLSASPNLWGKIEEGLAGSQYLIFLASKKAAESKWCRKEIEFWKEHKSRDQFLIAIMDGELVWDEQKTDFDWSKTTALPESLSGFFEAEPLYVDFRQFSPEDELSLDNPAFQERVVLLAATLHGNSVGEMIGEGTKQHKRTIRIRNSTIFVLSLLLIVSGILTVFGITQKNIALANAKDADEQRVIAEEERDEAELQANKLRLSNYVANARVLEDSDPTSAIRLAQYAYGFADSLDLPTNEAEDELIRIFHRNDFHITPPATAAPEDDAAVREEWNAFTFKSYGDSISLTNKQGERIHTFTSADNISAAYNASPHDPSFSPGGNFIILKFGYTGTLICNRINRQTLTHGTGGMGVYSSLHPRYYFDDNDQYLLQHNNGNKTSALYSVTQSKTDIHHEFDLEHEEVIVDATISGNGKYVLSADRTGLIKCYDVALKQSIRQFNVPLGKVIIEIKFIDNEDVIMAITGGYSSDTLAYFWSINEKTKLFEFQKLENMGAQNPEYDRSKFVYLEKQKLFTSDGEELAMIPGGDRWIDGSCTFRTKKYRGNRAGLFAQDGTRLIQIHHDMSAKPSGYANAAYVPGIGYSVNEDYFIAGHIKWMGIYPIAPNLIISMLNGAFGNNVVAPLSPEIKARYGVDHDL